MSNSTFNSIAVTGIVSSVPSKKIRFKNFDKKNDEIYENSFNKSSEFQTTSDFGYIAARRLLEEKQIPLNEIGVIIFVSKTPDYRGPATATVLHGRLNLSVDCIAYDVNIGSSGFIYGTQIICSHLDSINKDFGLLIVGDTATKQISEDENSSMFFGDGASAILFEKKEGSEPINISTKAYGDNYKFYSIQKGGFRKLQSSNIEENIHERSTENNFIEINKKEFLKFIHTEVSKSISNFLKIFGLQKKKFDVLALHQFNEDTINTFSKEQKNSYPKIPIIFHKFGNTCGNTIPLLLVDTFSKVQSQKINLLACSYGEGFSLGVMNITINSNDIFDIIETNEYFKEGFISH